MENQEAIEKKKRKLILLILLFLLLLSAGVATFFFSGSFHSEPKVVSGLPELEENLEVMTDEQMLKFMQAKVDKDTFNINLKHEISVSRDDNMAQIAVKNTPKNAYSIQVEYILKANNKRIYRSGLIPPNHQLMNVKLSDTLSEGKHEVMILYTIFDQKKEINQSAVDGFLYVS